MYMGGITQAGVGWHPRPVIWILGHSLLASQVVIRLCAYVNHEIRLRILNDASTLEDLANIICESLAKQANETAVDRLPDELASMSNDGVEAATRQRDKVARLEG